MQDFLEPAYFAAVFTAIKYGGLVLIGMIAAGSAFTVLSGGPAARNWKKTAGGHH